MKEEQNKIMSCVIDYIMVTTNKYDYKIINNAMNNEKTPPNRLKMWRQLQIKPGIRTVITRTRDVSKARIQQIGLKQTTKSFMRRQMANDECDNYLSLTETAKLYIDFCDFNCIVNLKFFKAVMSVINKTTTTKTASS